MESHAQSNPEIERRTRIIQDWIEMVVATAGYERHDDLHIDQIDKRWRHPEHWIEGGLQSFRIAHELRDRLQIDLSLMLVFRLKYSRHPRGAGPEVFARVQEKCLRTPPSLYLFKRGKEPWSEAATRSLTSFKTMAPPRHWDLTNSARCHYTLWKCGPKEYVRSLWVEAGGD